MLSSYPVACPHMQCGWAGNLVPSHLKGGLSAEIVSMHRAWFCCPSCRGNWEVRITDDIVTVLPLGERFDSQRGDGGNGKAARNEN